MAEQTTSGGSNAADFQPTTGNPQTDVGGGLQPNSATLQPITTSNGTNVFNQPGINPQAFPQTSSLRVLSSSSEPATSPPETNNGPNSPDWGALTLLLIAAVVLLSLLIFIAKIAKPPTAVETEPSQMPAPAVKPARPRSKKKSSARRRTKRKAAKKRT